MSAGDMIPYCAVCNTRHYGADCPRPMTTPINSEGLEKRQLVERMAKAYQRANSTGTVSYDGIEAALEVVLASSLPLRDMISEVRNIQHISDKAEVALHELTRGTETTHYELEGLINGKWQFFGQTDDLERAKKVRDLHPEVNKTRLVLVSERRKVIS